MPVSAAKSNRILGDGHSQGFVSQGHAVFPLKRKRINCSLYGPRIRGPDCRCPKLHLFSRELNDPVCVFRYREITICARRQTHRRRECKWTDFSGNTSSRWFLNCPSFWSILSALPWPLSGGEDTRGRTCSPYWGSRSCFSTLSY